MSVELKPCPFCGSAAEIDTDQSFRGFNSGKIESSVALYCSGCVVSFQHCYSDHPGVERDELRDDLITSWNRRAERSAGGVDVDFTREEVDAVIEAATQRGTRNVPIECIEQMRGVLTAAISPRADSEAR